MAPTASVAHDGKKANNGGAEARTGRLPHELMLELAQTGLREIAEPVANGGFTKRYVVLSVSERIKLAKACAPYYALKVGGRKQPTKARTGPHELMLEWAQTGLMQVPQRVANGCFVKKYAVLSVSRRIRLAKTCARYFAAKLVGQEQPSRDEQAAQTKHGADRGTDPRDLMLEWVQTGTMELPERFKNGYFVKKLSVLSVSRHLHVIIACLPYYAPKITHQAPPAPAKAGRLVSSVAT